MCGWWQIFQLPHPRVVRFAIFAEQAKAPTDCDLSSDLCDTIHDSAAVITVFLDEVLRCPFYVKLVKDTLDNERATFYPKLSKSFLGESRIIERDCWVKGFIRL